MPPPLPPHHAVKNGEVPPCGDGGDGDGDGDLARRFALEFDDDAAVDGFGALRSGGGGGAGTNACSAALDRLLREAGGDHDAEKTPWRAGRAFHGAASVDPR